MPVQGQGMWRLGSFVVGLLGGLGHILFTAFLLFPAMILGDVFCLFVLPHVYT